MKAARTGGCAVKHFGHVSRSTHLKTERIDIVWRLWGPGTIQLSLIGVQLLHLEVFKERAVKLVPPGLGHDGHNSTAGAAVLSVIVVRSDLETPGPIQWSEPGQFQRFNALFFTVRFGNAQDFKDGLSLC